MKRVCVNRLRNEVSNMATMINRMDSNDHIQDLFECIYKICLQEQDSMLATHPTSGKSGHFSQAPLSPGGASAVLQNMNTQYDNSAAPRGLQVQRHIPFESDQNGSHRINKSLSISNLGSSSHYLSASQSAQVLVNGPPPNNDQRLSLSDKMTQIQGNKPRCIDQQRHHARGINTVVMEESLERQNSCSTGKVDSGTPCSPEMSRHEQYKNSLRFNQSNLMQDKGQRAPPPPSVMLSQELLTNHRQQQNQPCGLSNQMLNRSVKEAVKVVIQLMVEDIWQNFENYSLQKRVVQQSQDLKKRGSQQNLLRGPQSNHHQRFKSTQNQTQIHGFTQGISGLASEEELRDMGSNALLDKSKNFLSQQCPYESKVYSNQHPSNPLVNYESASLVTSQNSCTGSKSPSCKNTRRQNQNSNSLILNKKHSVQSNFKMDFIDPSRNNNQGFGYNDKIVNLKPHSQTSRSSRADKNFTNSRRDKYITMEEGTRRSPHRDKEITELRVTKSSPSLSDIRIPVQEEERKEEVAQQALRPPVRQTSLPEKQQEEVLNEFVGPMKANTIKLQRQGSSGNISDRRLVNQVSDQRRHEFKHTYTSTSLMSPLDLEELEGSNTHTQIRERERITQLNIHEQKLIQSTQSSEDLKFQHDQKNLTTDNRNSSATRKPPKSHTASLQSPKPKQDGLLPPKMSPELAQVLMMNVQAFEQNAISNSGDKLVKSQLTACDIIREESPEAEVTNSNVLTGTNGLNTGASKFEIDQNMSDQFPANSNREQPPTNRSSKYEDFNIYELEQKEEIEQRFKIESKPPQLLAPPVEKPKAEKQDAKLFSGKKYIDDFASSSDELDAISENENALPMVEQVMDAHSFQPPSISNKTHPYNHSGEEYQLKMISIDQGVKKQRLGNDMSLSGGDMQLKNNHEELKTQTKPRSITQAQLLEGQSKLKKQQPKKNSNTKPKVKEIAISKCIDNQKHYYSTAKTTPRNQDTNPKSTRNKKNIQLELKAAVSKQVAKRQSMKSKRALSDKQMAVSAFNVKLGSSLQESFFKDHVYSNQTGSIVLEQARRIENQKSIQTNDHDSDYSLPVNQTIPAMNTQMADPTDKRLDPILSDLPSITQKNRMETDPGQGLTIDTSKDINPYSNVLRQQLSNEFNPVISFDITSPEGSLQTPQRVANKEGSSLDKGGSLASVSSQNQATGSMNNMQTNTSSLPMETIQEYQSPQVAQNKTMSAMSHNIISPVLNKTAKGTAPTKSGSSRKLSGQSLKMQQQRDFKKMLIENAALGRQSRPTQPSRTQASNSGLSNGSQSQRSVLSGSKQFGSLTNTLSQQKPSSNKKINNP